MKIFAESENDVKVWDDDACMHRTNKHNVVCVIYGTWKRS